MNYTVIPDDPAVSRPLLNGSHLVGYMHTTYKRLVELFGEPNESVRAPDKEDAAWVIQFDDGAVANIYNYKDGRAYLGKRGKRVEHITERHVGSPRDETFARVVEVVGTDAAATLDEVAEGRA